MPKRILVLSAAVGAGHLRAAEAVELAIKESRPDVLVKNVDVLSLTNATFRKLYGGAYLELVNRTPHVLGYFYDYLDKARNSNSKRDKLRALVGRLNLGELDELLHSQPWDVIINTHFLPAEIVAGLRRKRKLKVPQVTVTTDFETHRLWVNEPTDLYCTATDEGAAYLRHWGVENRAIRVTGIPIHPVFSRPIDRGSCLRAHGLAGDKPVVLQLAGGFGVGPIEATYRQILSITKPMEIVVVTGRNEDAKKTLGKIKPPPQHKVMVMGFTRQVDELMAAADVVVTKPGGLTSSEVLARGAAMAIVNPIPGQETRNSDYLLEHGAAIKINNIGTLAFKLTELLSRPDRLASLKRGSLALAKPKAAFDVANFALKMT